MADNIMSTAQMKKILAGKLIDEDRDDLAKMVHIEKSDEYDYPEMGVTNKDYEIWVDGDKGRPFIMGLVKICGLGEYDVIIDGKYLGPSFEEIFKSSKKGYEIEEALIDLGYCIAIIY